MIYKIFRENEYLDFVVDGSTKGSPIDQSDGFIHFSTASQLPATLKKHFAEEAVLHLLAFDEHKLGAVKWEKSRDDQLFPHHYGTLVFSDIEAEWEILEHQLPKGL